MAERNAMEARKYARVVFWIKNNVPNQNKPQQSHRCSYSENTCGAQKNATAVTPPQWWMSSCIIFSLALNVSRSSAHHLVATMQAWCRDFPKKRTGSSDCWWYTKRCAHVWVRPWMRIEALHVKESVQFMKNMRDGGNKKNDLESAGKGMLKTVEGTSSKRCSKNTPCEPSVKIYCRMPAASGKMSTSPGFAVLL